MFNLAFMLIICNYLLADNCGETQEKKQQKKRLFGRDTFNDLRVVQFPSVLC